MLNIKFHPLNTHTDALSLKQFIALIIKINIRFHPLIPMLPSYISWHPFALDFRGCKTVFDAIVVGRWSVFGFHFLCMPSSVRMILFPA